MQSKTELIDIISKGRPDIELETATLWAEYLSQLTGCSLQSVIAQSVDEEAWLKEREKGIGGSEIAAIAGKSPWNTAYQLWLGKTGQYDMLTSKPQSEPARWGNLLEKTVADEWALRYDRQYINIPVILHDDEYPFMFANIDGFTLSDDRERITGILEVKTTGAYNAAAWEVGPIPEYYLCQTNWYTRITGLLQYTIICLIGGQKLVQYPDMPLDKELTGILRTAAIDFWFKNIVAYEPPELQGGDKDTLLLKTAPVEEKVEPAIYTDDASENLADAYCNIRDQITSLKNIQEVIYAKLIDKLENTNEALTRTHTLRLQQTNRRNCDFDLLEASYPQAYADCITSSKSISLQVK